MSLLISDNIIEQKRKYNGKMPKGGNRGEIIKFSGSSRRRLLRKYLNYDFSKGDNKLVTLTLPQDITKEQYDISIKRFRNYIKEKQITIIYKIEFTKKGVVHLHGMVWAKDNSKRFWYYRSQILYSWVRAFSIWFPARKNDMLKTSIKYETARKKAGSCWYTSLYQAKEIGKVIWHNMRYWGVINKEKLEIYKIRNIFIQTRDIIEYPYEPDYGASRFVPFPHIDEIKRVLKINYLTFYDKYFGII